ncbi:MAG: hypothetical protein ACFB10_10205 [Salibacteraceae bacterium]
MRGLVLLSLAWVLLVPLSLCAQSKRFLAGVDSAVVVANPYLDYASAQAFFASGLANELIDPDHPDDELLEATLYYAYNAFRKKSRLEPLEWHQSLQQQTQVGIEVFGFRKYEAGLHPSVERYVHRASASTSFKGRLLVPITLRANLVVLPHRNRWHFDRKRAESPYQLYLGVKQEEEEEEPALPLEGHTYRSFAEAAIQQWCKGRNRKYLLSKAYTYTGISVRIEPQTLRRSRPPSAKAMLLLGGYRTEALMSKQE